MQRCSRSFSLQTDSIWIKGIWINFEMKWYVTVMLFFNIRFDSSTERLGDTEKNVYKLGKYKQCMAQFGIPLWKIVDSTSNATSYNLFNYQWNKHFEPVFPIAIFVPSTVSDVQATVKCGFKVKISLSPSSGSHSYAGLSLGTNHSIIVDFRFMKSIHIDHEEGSVTVDAGAFIGHMNAKLWKNGGWGVPAGNCMTVAMGGHGLGGGYSFYANLYGLVIDNILEIKMVDPRGNAVTVNPTQNSDLWWALRGIGPGYIGLVTSYKLKMFKAKDVKLTSVQIQYKIKDFQYVVESYYEWLEWVRHNEPSVSSFVIAVNDNYTDTLGGELFNPGVEVRLIHIQDPKIQPNSSSAFLMAFPKIFPKPAKTVVNNVSYIEFLVSTSYSPVSHTVSTTSQPVSANDSARTVDKKLEFFSGLTKEMALSRYSIQKSFFVNKRFRANDLKQVQKVLAEIPNHTCAVVINSERGAISSKRSTDSVYAHRNELFNVRFRFEGLHHKDVVAGEAWMERFWKSTRFMDSGKTFPNYPDINLKDFLVRYYGTNLMKLIQIKRKWDPKGYFHSKQSIPTAF